MKISNKLWLIASNLLVANCYHIRRDLFEERKIEIYRSVTPTSFEQIARDAQNSNRILRLSKSTVDVTPSLNLDKGKYIKKVLDDPFSLNVHCSSKELCGDYPQKVQEGAIYVAKALEFYNTVNVNVTIFPFCRYLNDESCQSIMGITYPPTFVSLQHGNEEEEYLYPQALVKQLNVGTKYKYDDIDFIIYLNCDYRPDAAHDNRSLIAAHEILHGLGFFHQINPVSVYINSYKQLFNEDFALPPIKYVEEKNTVRYDGFTPFSIFDKFIVSTANPSQPLYTKLLKFRDHPINFEINPERPTQKQYSTFINSFKNLYNDVEARQGGVEVANLFKTLNAVGFRTKDGSVVELQTFDGNYESASSISHINVPFPCKNSGSCNTLGRSPEENYLMYFTVISKASTDTLIRKFQGASKYDLIGPNIVKIMTTLGWNERNGNNNNNDDTEYQVPTKPGYSYSDATHLTSSTSIMIILSFVFLCFTYII